MLTNAKRTYALKEWTVELRPKGWYYRPTYSADTHWRGPYSSEASVSLMLARELKREIKRRDAVHQLPE